MPIRAKFTVIEATDITRRPTYTFDHPVPQEHVVLEPTPDPLAPGVVDGTIELTLTGAALVGQFIAGQVVVVDIGPEVVVVEPVVEPAPALPAPEPTEADRG